MNTYDNMTDIELLAEYNELCDEMDEMEESDYGSYQYDCLSADLYYLYSILAKKGLL